MNNGTRIKLFADAHVFDKEFQGTRTFIKELYTALAREKGLEIFLGAYDVNKLADTFSDSPDIKLIKYKGRSAFTRLLYSIPEIITRNKIDFAHFQYIIPPQKKCTYIVTIHDVLFNEFPGEFTYPYRLSKKMLYRDAARRADIITTVSNYSKRSIEKHLGLKKGNIHIIPNGISERFFQAYDKPNSKKYVKDKFGVEKTILYVSRFEPRKNHSGLLKAWLELRLYERGYWLVMLGSQTLKVPEFENLINQLPDEAKKFVFIRKAIDDHDLLEFYRAADVFIYPSRAEGFGISPLEAGAAKVPVICSNSSAMGQFSFFEAGHINTSNNEQLKEILSAYINQPPSAEKLTEISNIIHQQYSWRKSAQQFYELLSESNNPTNTGKQSIKQTLNY